MLGILPMQDSNENCEKEIRVSRFLVLETWVTAGQDGVIQEGKEKTRQDGVFHASEHKTRARALVKTKYMLVREDSDGSVCVVVHFLPANETTGNGR